MKTSKWSATHFRTLSLLLLIGTLTNNSLAAPGDVDLSLVDPGFGINGRVNAVVVQPDGELLVAGSFTTEVSIPTNGGSYRLALQCIPDSRDPRRSQGTLRYRIADWSTLGVILRKGLWFAGTGAPSWQVSPSTWVNDLRRVPLPRRQ